MEGKGKERSGCTRWIRLLLFALVSGLVLFLAGYDIMWVYANSNPVRREICCSTPLDYGYSFKDVKFSTQDGPVLSGWYIPSKNGAAVILLHGYGANRMEMLGRAVMLADHGYGVFLYDQRASGESEGELRSFGWLDVEDVRAALDLLTTYPDVDQDRIGILGFSQGGQIALRAAAENEQIKAAIAEEPGFSVMEDIPEFNNLYDRWLVFQYRIGLFGIRWRTGVTNPSGVVEGLAKITPRPMMFIASHEEEDAEYIMVRYYYDLVDEPKEWWSVPEAKHGQIPEVRPVEYEAEITDFFNEWLFEDSD
ncbi:MAG: alpha/beta fold hydrolase [Anaerolineales bacterium]|nr:alpha/beta fold hydrolase [Anaerolineales bacterium]